MYSGCTHWRQCGSTLCSPGPVLLWSCSAVATTVVGRITLGRRHGASLLAISLSPVMASSASTSTSLADELTGRLSHHIDLVAASITSTAAASSPGETEAQGTGEQEEDGHLAGSSQSDSDGTDDAEAEAAASLAALSASLSRVRHRNHSGHGGGHSGHGGWERAKRLTDEALREQTGIKRRTLPSAIVSSSSSSPSIQVEQLQWILNAHLTASAWGAVLQQLLDEADRVKHEEDYWQSVEGEDSSGLMFLVQSGSRLRKEAASVLRHVDHPAQPCQSEQPTPCAFSISASI